ncbi:neurogenic protein mastermind [Halyomorpha halys]|uniref:neurogenic protein mastermind n=1 Tax=Halyomorpha halys TaxID=286706 RepID=UPI0006D4EDAB|nr:neurogenic protein mastermind [Halyomorpha halys]
MPRFDHSFNGVVEQNLQDTLVLKQRFLENKPKRPVKKSEKKPAENSMQNNLSLAKFPKCSAPDDNSDNFADASKSQQKHENMTKFSVEIVQQLEFTTTSTNSQISTNVTVKALNTSVKGDVPNSPQSPRNLNIIECKQEPENIEFVDLEQCAAALEKDAAANGGNSFPGLSDLIGDDTNDAISSDAFKDLISEISEYNPEFMKDFDFDGGESKRNEEQQKMDAMKNQPQVSGANVQNVLSQQRLCGSNLEMGKPELSPAAQTLKNMAEQHQHNAQMGIGFNFKVSSSYPTDGIKQENFSAQNSPVGYTGSPSGKTPSPQRINNQYKQVYQFSGQMSPQPQYRPQQPVKLDYSKNQLSHQSMITFSQAGMLQPMPPSGPMLRAPQPQYLPRYNLSIPRASYNKAPRLPQQEPTWMIQRPQQEPTWMIQRPQQDFLSEAHINQLQMSRMQQQIQMNQVRVHQSMSALSRSGTVPFSSAYTNTNTNYAQSNFNMHQNFTQQNSLAPEFSLDFLEQLPHSDATNFSDQELFSSLDTGTNFNFDIL